MAGDDLDYGFTHDTDDGWRVSMSVQVRAGVPSIVAVRIEQAVPSGEQIDAAPAGGLTAERFRTLPFGQIAAEAKAKHGLAIEDRAVTMWHESINAALDDEPAPSGRQGHTDRFYAAIAAAFVLALWRGKQAPTREVAMWTDATERSASNWLRLARRLGYLSPAPPGKAGGQLSPEAKALLGITIELPA
jgi:hypothetical protein